MKVINVDLDRCQGHGKCYMVAPDMFDFQDDHGRSQFVGAPIDPQDEDRMKQGRRAVQACPEAALRFADQDEPGETT